ncbi:MAG: hypothetical protein CMN73_04585 [Sphingomonas sp.]|nr:hypothetical protein [Sphingomonas sp.]
MSVRPSLFAGAALLLALGACSGGEEGGNNSIDEILTEPLSTAASSGAEIVDAGGDLALATQGTTPMAEREAVLGFLNKRNGETREIKLKPGQAMRIGDDVVVRLRACERTAPWEPEEYTGAFVQLDVRDLDGKWGRVFSGWLYKERPSLNVIQHGIYDVWPKSCAMTFPDGGPDTVSASAVGRSAAAPSRSSAPKAPASSPTPAASPTAQADVAPATAESSNPR